MDPYATSHFSHRALLADLRQQAARECGCCAVVLSRIAEVDERQLFRLEGYPSMHAFCMGELNYTEDAAYKRLYAARAGRRFPLILLAVADGRLHLSGVVMLSSHLTSGNVDELVAAATRKSKAQIAQLIAERFPRADLPERLQALSATAPVQEFDLAPGQAEVALPAAAPAPVGDPTPPVFAGSAGMPAGCAVPGSTGPRGQLAPGQVEAPRPRVTPLAPERFGLQVTLDQESYDLLQQARDLMSHQNPGREIAPVLKSALRLLVAQLEKRKFAATARPRAASQGHTQANENGGNASRHIAADVKRAVRERDEGCCTFVSENGKRCGSRRLLQYDHVEPVARGGKSTADNVRLRCRSHNQLEAERAFGAEFMEQKRRAR